MATAVKERAKKTASNGNGEHEGATQDLVTSAGRITIPAPNLQTAAFKIVGVSPLVMNKFSEKALQAIRDKQEEGSTAKKGRKREPKDFAAAYQGAIHYSTDGWIGFPAAGVRAAFVSACRTVNFKMVLAKLSLFVEADGFDATEGSPLVKITHGKPRHVEHYVRIAMGAMDIRARAMFDPGWKATIRVTFDADQFTLQDVGNLLSRVGRQVGIGEGRNDSRSSAGMGWGVFKLEDA